MRRETLKFGVLGVLLMGCGKTNDALAPRGSISDIEVTPGTLVTLIEASPSSCSTGGTLILTYRDNNFSYSFDEEDEILQESYVCNGSNGRDGSDGQNGENGRDAALAMGAVGPRVEGRNYSACHHDYLYIPNSHSSSQGWLLFRHQFNGSQDQGIGTSGFQVWNVDINDFVLASELGNISYCRMKWNKETRVLSYKVIDESDGLAGVEGEIAF